MKRLRLVLLLLLLVSGSSAAFAASTRQPAPTPSPLPAFVPAETTFFPGAGLASPTPNPPTPAPSPLTPRVTEPARLPVPLPEVLRGEETRPLWPMAQTLQWAPTRLEIPDIGVDARVVGVGITDAGAMEAPAAYDQIGWLRSGVVPGEVGRAVLAGHVDSKTGPAVFYDLRELQPGDIINVTIGGTGEIVQFVVHETAQYPESETPLDRVFGPSDRPELVLITCAGTFDRALGAYDQRLVVYAGLHQPDPE